MISQEAAISAAHLQLDLFHGFTHQQPTQMEHPQQHTPVHAHAHARAYTHTEHKYFVNVQI